jgi:23S rRNA pseudouridine1911/1915/1917 synthase
VEAPDPGLLRAEVPKRLAGKRFDRALVELFDGMSGSELQRLVRKGRVKLDGKKVFRSNFKLRGGERLTVRIADPQRLPDLPLEFLHEDEHYAIVNKPPGMLVHGNEKQRGGTVADFAVERFGPLPSVDGDARPGIVHRLDRETSGVMVLARTKQAMSQLRVQFMEREIQKQYTALVYGLPDADEFEVDLALGPVPGKLDLQRVDPRGKSAHTSVRVTRRFEAHSLVECRPSTGRRHQIRVHLASAGFPVVGDKLYRPDSDAARPSGAWHHMLHASGLEFRAPGSAEVVRWSAPLPASFAALIDALDGRP